MPTHLISGKPLGDNYKELAAKSGATSMYWTSKRDLENRGYKLVADKDVKSIHLPSKYVNVVFNVDQLADPAKGFALAGTYVA